MHRYSGLILSLVLFIAGLTGSICAFQDEIDAALNPDLFQAAHPDHLLPLSALLARLKEQRPSEPIAVLMYRPQPGRSIEAFSSSDPSDEESPLQNEIFLDPSSGFIQGLRPAEGCCFNRRALMPFLYRVHYSLDLGKTGSWILGLSAILWTVDCLVGLILTFPLHPAAWKKDFWERWGKAWTIAFGRSFIRLTFDLHRAISLWLWVILLGIAISGVALALGDEVFEPVVRAVLPTDSSEPPEQPQTPLHAVIIDEAESIAAAFVQSQGVHARPAAVLLAPDGSTATFYLFSNSGAVPTGLGSPLITVDMKTGRIISGEIPGKGALGNLVLQLQFPWHSGEIAGLAGRIVICISGLAVCVLTVTGVMIWWRKRRLPPGRQKGL